MTKGDAIRLKVLILADECNPDWPSLPIVGYKYALELAKTCDVTVATHIRNRENIEKAGSPLNVVYLDTEAIAAPMYRLATFLRGGDSVAWSTGMIMAYLPYLAFEWKVWRHFRRALKSGAFDIVHRITPMSPTLPSYIAKRCPVPFVIGPLNGNLPWPRQFAAEQKREKERLRILRDFYKFLPYARSTQTRPAAILAGFDHTIRDLGRADPRRIVMVPEIGFDPAIFNAQGAAPAGKRGKGLKFLYAGRLVPYKLPEVVVRAFAASPVLRRHRLTIIGDGPEQPRLEALIAEHGLADCVHMAGRHSQAGVAAVMRDHDVFVFPSIRELGAGVVIEAMASGMVAICADYGAPGYLAGSGRGITVPLASVDGMADSYRGAMEDCAEARVDLAAIGEAARAYADGYYPWSVKAERTIAIYDAVLDGAPLGPHSYA